MVVVVHKLQERGVTTSELCIWGVRVFFGFSTNDGEIRHCGLWTR